MFTGIIEEIGKIKTIKPDSLTISAGKVLEDLKLGDSIAINGACLTVIALTNRDFTVNIMTETMKRTSFSLLRPGDPVNLERAMSAAGRFGGHFVQGHIDGTGRIMSLLPEDSSVIMRVAVPAEIGKYLVTKGFIAVDGVSLTIVDCDNSSFSVSLVTYSRANTILGKKKNGDQVNLEVDIMAKYIEKLNSKSNDDLLLDFLKG